MYQVYMRDILLPVMPYEIKVTKKGRNKVIDLINYGETNILKEKGLDEIELSFMLPNLDYPFSMGVDSSTRADYYIGRFEKFRNDKEVFSLVILRYFPDGSPIYSTDIKVTLEDYTYVESGENGFDYEVKVKLKEYKEYGTQKIKLSEKEDGSYNAIITESKRSAVSSPDKYTVKKGDTLWGIAKRFLGDGSSYKSLMQLNNLSNPNFITAGQVIRIK